MLVAGLVLGALIGVVAAATGAIGIAAALAMIEMILLFVLFFWLWTRFALAFPLTLLRGRIIIGESWRITRGRFWSLFAAFFVIVLILLILWVAVTMVTSGGYFAQLAKGGTDPIAMQQAAQQQMRQLGSISGRMVAGWIFGGIVGGLTVALWGGSVATAARELTVNPDEIAETFA
jgi:hypothetical protein